ncbi:MAG: hypothetical protein Q8L68_01895 [Methylococcales bacterium]|nr:hypothetical protein [Methylococcales bacterium]
MDTKKSLEIIRALANGFDPYTGEVFSDSSLYQHPQTIRAMFVAIEALERVEKINARQRNLPDNAGTAWTKEEDQKLISNFDSGKNIQQLAQEHQRTEGSIRSRLVKHGKIQL